MTEDDRKEFGAALAAVYALYRADITAPVAAIWWQALSGYDLPAVVDALGRHAMNPDVGQFLPKPADVVRQLEGSTQDAALLAWARVVEALKRHGTYVSVDFVDPIIHRVLTDLGGWMWLGQQTEKEMPFIEKRFRDAYRAWRARPALLLEAPVRLAGIIEHDNGANGYTGVNVVTKVLGGPAKLAIEGPQQAGV